jgi:hypothetical protein
LQLHNAVVYLLGAASVLGAEERFVLFRRAALLAERGYPVAGRDARHQRSGDHRSYEAPVAETRRRAWVFHHVTS